MGSEAASMPAAAPATQAPTASAAETSAANPALQAAPSEQSALGGAAGMAKALNPDVSVIGNFIGSAGHNAIAPVPSLSMRESEFGFQAVVDPYARADFFLSADANGASIEEGYLTFPALPGGFLAKIGRMRSNFGKLNPLHSHVLPWIDRPLIVNNLMGGDPGESDAGIKDEGLFISRILPAPRRGFLEASAEGDQGNSGSLFQASRRSDVSSIFRLRGYGDLNESTNVELGASYARGHNDVNNYPLCPAITLSDPTGPAGGSGTATGSASIGPSVFACVPYRDFGRDYITQLAGFDGTVRWKPLRRAIYHSFVGRTEWVWSRRQEITETQRAFGFYFS